MTKADMYVETTIQKLTDSFQHRTPQERQTMAYIKKNTVLCVIFLAVYSLVYQVQADDECYSDSDCRTSECCDSDSRICKSRDCDVTGTGWIVLVIVISVIAVIIVSIGVVVCCCCRASRRPAHGGVVVTPPATVGTTVIATQNQQNYPPPGQPMYFQNSQHYPNEHPQSYSNQRPLAYQPTVTGAVQPPKEMNTVKY